MMNALMPGDDNWMRGQPMPGQAQPAAPMVQPAKKRNPLMNALSSVFEFGAPEAFEQGRQKRMTRDVGNALAGGDYAGAANTYLKGGNIEQGLAVRGMGQEQDMAKRQQEAQSVLSLFSQMPAMQINEMAMSDPANFERMTGMTSEEYLQAAQRSGDPEKFREYVITKAQAELGQMPATPEPYTLAPGARRYGPDGQLVAENPVEQKPIEVNGVLVDPVTYEPIGDYRTPAQTGELTPYQQQQLRMEAARLGISEAELMLKIAQAEQTAASGTQRKYEKDPNGVLRYLDNGQPVFPGVTVAPAAPKPLIGSESMGRVAAGLGNMRQAVNDLSNLVMPKQEGGQGYAPGYDWGAKWLDASLPFVGDPLARWAGGKDYQKFENAYAAFEAAALPIMSGAAVTDSEAKRALKALRVKIGDSNEAVAAKMQNMQRMVQGLEMAAQGDTSFLQTAIETVDAGGTGGLDTMSDDDLKAALGIE